MSETNVIRRMQILFESQGFDKAASTIGQAADVLSKGAIQAGEFADAMVLVTQSMDKAANGASSSARKFATVQNTYIQGLREIRKLGADLTKAIDFKAQFGNTEAGAKAAAAAINEIYAAFGKLANSGRADAALKALLPDEEFVKFRVERIRTSVERALNDPIAKRQGIIAASQSIVRTTPGQLGPATAAATGQSDPRLVSFPALERLINDQVSAEDKLRAKAEQVTKALLDQRNAARGAADAHIAAMREEVAAIQRVEEELKKRQAMAARREQRSDDFDSKRFMAENQQVADDLNTTFAQRNKDAAAQREREAKSAVAALRSQAQEYEYLKSVAREWTSQLDVEGTALAAAKKKREDLAKIALYGNTLMDSRLVKRALAEIDQQIVNMERHLGKDGLANNLKFAEHNAINLAQQLNDVVTMGMMGASPGQIFATQAGQFYQIFAAEGGLQAGLQKTGKFIMDMITPARVLGGVLIGAAAGALYAWNDYLSSLKAVDAALTGAGRGTRASTSDIAAIAEKNAAAGDMSVKSAREFATEMARTGKIGTEVYGDLIKRARDFAATTGQDMGDAFKELTASFSDVSGWDKLQQRLGAVDAQQDKTIRQLFASGRAYDAQKEMVRAMDGALADHTKSLTLVGRAWDGFWRSISDGMNNVGKTLEPTLQQQAEGARKAFENARERALQDRKIGRPMGQREARQLMGAYNEAIDLDLRARDEALTTEARADQQRSADLGQRVASITAEFRPLNAQLDQLKARKQIVEDFLAPKSSAYQSPQALDNARKTLAEIEKQIDSVNRAQMAGGVDMMGMWKGQQTAAAVAGMTEYAAGLRRIRDEFDAQVEAANGNEEKINTINQARMSAIAALRDSASKAADTDLRSANFDAATASLSEYEKGLKAINFQYDEQVRQAKGAGQATATYEQARLARLTAFREQAIKAAKDSLDAARVENKSAGLEGLDKTLASITNQYDLLIGRAKNPEIKRLLGQERDTKLDTAAKEFESQTAAALRAADFSSRSAGMEDYAKQVAAINEKFREQTRGVQEGTKAYNDLKAARDAELQAFATSASKQQSDVLQTEQLNAAREGLEGYRKALAEINDTYDVLIAKTPELKQLYEAQRQAKIQGLDAATNLQAANTLKDADFQARIAGMSDFDKSLENIQHQLDLNTRNLDRGSQAYRDYAEAAKRSEDALRADALKSATDTLKDANFEASIAALDDYRAQLESINREYDKWLENNQKQSDAVKDAMKQRRDAQGDAAGIRKARSAFDQFAPEGNELSDMQDSLAALRRYKGELEAAGKSTDMVALAIARATTAIENWQTPLQRRIKDFELEIRSIHAVGIEEQAAIAAEQARTEALRDTTRNLNASAEAEMARAKVIAEGQRRLNDALRDARNQGELIGKKPFEQAQIQARQESDLRRQQDGNTGQNDQIDAVRQKQIRDQFLTGPLRGANEDLEAQVRLLQAEADGFGKSTYEATRLVEAQKMLNEYIAAGITPATIGVDAWNNLTKAVGAYADQAGKVAQTRENFERAKQTIDDIKDTSKDALKGFVSDIMAGKSATEALTNALQKLLNKLMDKMFDSVFDGLFGTGKSNGSGDIFDIGKLLTGGIKAFLGVSDAPAIARGGPSNASGNLNGGGFGGDPYSSYGLPGAIPASAPSMGASSPFAALIRSVEGTSGANGYNTSLANGKFLPGGQEMNLTSMNLGQIRELQNAMLRNPANDYNSSALGMGQFTRTTLDGYRQKFGLGDDVKFDEDFQNKFFDYLAMKRGPNPDGLRSEWQGANRLSDDDLLRAYKQTYGGTGPRAELTGGAANDNLTGSMEKLQGGFDDLSQSTQSLTPGFSQLSQTVQQTAPQIGQNLTGLGQSVTQQGQGVGDALSNTASTVQQSGTSLGNAFSQAIQSVQQAGSGGGGGGGLGGLFKGLFGGGGNISYNIDPLTGQGFHDGGLVGGTPTFTRALDPRMFASAPRYHAGFRPDEVPAVLQQGEWVLSRNDVARIKSGSNDNATNDNGLTVNVINAPSQPDVKKNGDGSVDIMFRDHEDWLAERAKRGRGNLAKSMNATAAGQNLIG